MSDQLWSPQRPCRFLSVPAWGVNSSSVPVEKLTISGLPGVTREWAWGGSDGAGVRVCVVDTGVDEGHPRVGPLERSAAITVAEHGGLTANEPVSGDPVGHGTACAGIIRSVAPNAYLSSMRVLTRGKYGTGDALLAGLSWAIEQKFDVVNLSLAARRPSLEAALRELADRAHFRRMVLVVSAHNMPVESYPWRFASVMSVASHNEVDPTTFYYNPTPPVDFYAKGVRVTVAWVNGTERVSTGNSFAAPHVTGLCALVLSKHRWLWPFQLKAVLMQLACNVAGSPSAPTRKEFEGHADVTMGS